MEAAMSLDDSQTLVLNADYRPVSYFPLSLWSWQDAVQAVFGDRVDIVAEYDREIAEHGDEAAERRGAALLHSAAASSGLQPREPVPARPVPLPILRPAVQERGADVRPPGAA